MHATTLGHCNHQMITQERMCYILYRHLSGYPGRLINFNMCGLNSTYTLVILPSLLDCNQPVLVLAQGDTMPELHLYVSGTQWFITNITNYR